jgi:Asp-tRNA(Asn)/Glu-tRNA(Gln) amidotransferase B subunit
MDESSPGITMAAAKYVLKIMVEKHKAGEDTESINIQDIIDEHNLWMADEWSHIGYIIVTCLESTKLVAAYNKGNIKVFDSLLGKTIKMSNMTTDPDFIREMLPVIINQYFANIK